jgi:phosphatidylserine decarboxylase
MTLRTQLHRLLAHEDLNFLLTNRVPRQALTRFMGWFSKIEQPWVRDASIAIWKYFSDLDLQEARQQHFRSMHDCFTRELKPGARPLHTDPLSLSSPCDAIVGAHGHLAGTQALQAKGMAYALEDLIPKENLQHWRDGYFVTLRLTSGMYHRFHAPYDATVDTVRYFSGDTWNVNPIALKRVEKLFCKNERAYLRMRLDGDAAIAGQHIALIPVAAILVASIRLHFLNVLLHLKYRGADTLACQHPCTRSQEMGWFEHGSTIIVLAPAGFTLDVKLHQGSQIRMGEALLHWTH